jgi:hypothetical protein
VPPAFVDSVICQPRKAQSDALGLVDRARQAYWARPGQGSDQDRRAAWGATGLSRARGWDSRRHQSCLSPARLSSLARPTAVRSRHSLPSSRRSALETLNQPGPARAKLAPVRPRIVRFPAAIGRRCEHRAWRQIPLNHAENGSSKPKIRGPRKTPAICTAGFQDRRIQPLCHPSASVSDATRSCGMPEQPLHWHAHPEGEVAEWLKALAC